MTLSMISVVTTYKTRAVYPGVEVQHSWPRHRLSLQSSRPTKGREYPGAPQRALSIPVFCFFANLKSVALRQSPSKVSLFPRGVVFSSTDLGQPPFLCSLWIQSGHARGHYEFSKIQLWGILNTLWILPSSPHVHPRPALQAL